MKLHKNLDTLFKVGTAAGLSDDQSLGRFVARRGTDAEAQAAFAALVDRHGAMVLRVRRQVLGHAHDAEDATQATFLVLARRAGSIGRRESVASWLHGVALRVAAKVRRADGRRQKRERRASEMMASPNETNREAEHELYHQLHRASADGPAFRLSRQNKCLDPVYPDRLQGMLRRDVTDLTIRLEPGKFEAALSSTAYGLDPVRLADFEEAKAGPITGVPPG